MVAGTAVIALDVGGSSVKSAAVRAGEVLGAISITPLDSSADAGHIIGALAAIVERHLEALGDTPCAGVALGFPGPFDYAAGISLIAGVAKYERLYGLNVGEAVLARLHRPGFAVRFRNDAEAAIVGEAVYGVGKGYHRLIGLTLGTGLGSTFLVDGARLTGGPGVPPDGWLYAEPFAGQRADDIFSTRGLVARLRQVGLWVADLHQAHALARQGNQAAVNALGQFGADLGMFLQPFVAGFGAEAVLLLGGITHLAAYFLPPLLGSLPVPVHVGQLGARAALLGVAQLFE